jgi:hypothetical protein
VGKGRILLITGLSLILQGCGSTYSLVEFEILEPATVSFPEGTGHIIVMNRAPISFDSFDEDDLGSRDDKQLLMLDSMIVNNMQRGLHEVLKQSPIERFRTPLWLAERRFDTASLEDLLLTRREVESLCETWGGDVIISLENYTLDIDDHTIYYTDVKEVQTHYFEVSNTVQWSIYFPGRPKPYNTYNMVDTLFFTDLEDGMYKQVPSLADRVRILFYESGFKYGQFLVPVWTEAARTLFKGKHDSLKLASKLTDNGEWDQAFRLWEVLTGSEDSTVVAKAFHNMAVYYELEDNLDSASMLINLAMEYDTLEVIRFYKDELDIRIENRKEVIQQIGN